MKSLFQPEVQVEILSRITSLHKNREPLWGSMNLFQMVRHCVLAERHYHGQLPVKPPAGANTASGSIILRKFLKDDRRMPQNAPTASEFVIRETEGDLDLELSEWKGLISAYGSYPSNTYTHWFFGKMTRNQMGQLSYRHNDHHLRQFGA